MMIGIVTNLNRQKNQNRQMNQMEVVKEKAVKKKSMDVQWEFKFVFIVLCSCFF